jgi:hypothetical protein
MTAPLVPPEVDLQDFPFMPLHVARLRDSDLAAESSPEACWYAVLLWAASWHQLPAASLPANDAVLARLCGLGRDVRTFKRHRAAALRGFVLCDDGRLYHAVVAEQALASWDRKLQQRWRAECGRIKKQNQRHGADEPTPTFEDFVASFTARPQVRPEDVPGDSGESPSGHSLQETGTGTGTPIEDATASFVGSASIDPWAKDGDFLAAWISCTERGRTRSSRKQAWAVWKAHPAEPSTKLAALKAYLAKDPDVKRTGGPGFHLWLRDKLDEWLRTPIADEATPAGPVWPGPAEIRAAVVGKMDEAWTRSWLDPCEWDEDGRAILAPRDFTVRQLEQNVRKQLSDARVEQVRVKGRAA